MTARVFLYRPRDFNPQVEVAGCYCEYEDRILLLKRHADKIEGLRWGVPAGKIEAGEKPIQTAQRELFEETGIQASKLTPVGVLYIRRPEVDFIFHLFFLPLHQFPLLNVAAEEHIEECWVNLQEAKKLPLVSGAEEALEYFYLWKNDRNLEKRTYE